MGLHSQLPIPTPIMFLTFFFCFSSTGLLLPTRLPLPSCLWAQPCNPRDSHVRLLCPWRFQARILEGVAISFSFKEIFSFDTISIRVSASSLLHHHYLPSNPSIIIYCLSPFIIVIYHLSRRIMALGSPSSYCPTVSCHHPGWAQSPCG